MSGSAKPARVSAACARRSAARARRAATRLLPGRAVAGVQGQAELVEAPGCLVGPDTAGGRLRRDLLVGGEQQLHADALGRVRPAQRAQLPVCAARRRAPQFPQRELEQDGADDRHEAERLGGARAARGVGRS